MPTSPEHKTIEYSVFRTSDAEANDDGVQHTPRSRYHRSLDGGVSPSMISTRSVVLCIADIVVPSILSFRLARTCSYAFSVPCA